MSTEFGNLLKVTRLNRGYGLRQFAELVGELPSNLSAIEHGKRNPPAAPEKLRRYANTLALKENSPEWEKFFFLAKQPGRLPADLQHFTEQEVFPLVCRKLTELRPTENELLQLVKLLERIRKKSRKNAAT